jgi:hypothetical protein
LLAVVRLGDADRLGWWRSHSVDDVAEFVLGESFPNTWLATGLELAMETNRVRLRSSVAGERTVGLNVAGPYPPGVVASTPAAGDRFSRTALDRADRPWASVVG